MLEYGGAVRQAGDVGGRGGSFDAVDAVMDTFSDLVSRVAALPVEVLVVIAAVMLIGGFIFFRRP